MMKERWCFDRQGGWKRGIANTPGMRTHPACAKASGPRAATSATATRRKSILMLDKKPIRSRSVLRMMRDWSGRGCVQCAAYDDARLEGLVIVLECDGVLVDIHNNGHRRAFNMAFEEMGYSCSQWSTPVYFDLLRFGDSTGPGLIKTYFDMVGWPIMLSTADRGAFVEKIYGTKQKIFKDLMRQRDIELRDGAVEFLDNLLDDGISPVLIGATASAPLDDVMGCVLDLLGPDRANKISCLMPGEGIETVESEEGEHVQQEGGKPVSFEQQIAEAQGKMKAQAAQSFARAINLQNRGAGMRVDPSLFASKQRANIVSPTYFAAIVAAKGGVSSKSALVAASHGLMESAKMAGLKTFGVPPSLAARGGYTAMDAGFDGFGAGGGLTWRKLKAILLSESKP